MAAYTEEEEKIIENTFLSLREEGRVEGVYSSIKSELSKNGYERSEESIRSKRRRMGLPSLLDETDSPETTSEDREKDYYYEQDTDCYMVFVSYSDKPIPVPGPTHRSIVKDYTTGSTIQDIVSGYSLFTEESQFKEYKRVFGLTHGSEVFPDEYIKEKDVEDLVDQKLKYKQQELQKKWEKKKWRELKKKAHQFLELEKNLKEPLEDLIAERVPNYNVETLDIKKADSPYSLIVGLYDLHFGSEGAIQDPKGNSYTIDNAKDLLKEKTESIFSEVAKVGKPEEVVVVLGGDWFHVDCLESPGTTTAGTPQGHVITPEEIVWQGNELAVSYVDYVRQIADKVKVYVIRGNHDYETSAHLHLYLDGWYRNTGEVEVCGKWEDRKYYKYGNSLCMFTHGKEEKRRDLGPIIAKERRDLWSQTKFSYAFIGHLHHHEVKDTGGTKVFQLPTLVSPDQWHKKQGYILADRTLPAYGIDKKSGLSRGFYENVIS